MVTKSHTARTTELSIFAVSNILEELLIEGLICHSEKNFSKRGLNN